MKSNLILIVNGEPNSIFSEILLKSINKINIKNPIIFIFSKRLLELQMKKLNFKKNIKLLNFKKINQYNLDNKSINLIDIEQNQKVPFKNISSDSNKFIKKSFEIAFKIIKKEK